MDHNEILTQNYEARCRWREPKAPTTGETEVSLGSTVRLRPEKRERRNKRVPMKDSTAELIV